MKIPAVAVYIRVSTKAQRYDSQEREVLDYCKRRGWRVDPEHVYREKKPGSNAPRTELDRLMQDARGGKFSVVAIYKLDRLGRSLSHLLQVMKELRNLRIGVICTSQGIDTSANDSAANLQLNVLASVAEFERELIKDRTLAGLETARRRGVKLGRPATSPAKIAQVRELAAGKGRGWNLKAIAHETKLSVGMVWKILNPKPEKPVHKSPPAKKGKSSLRAVKTH